ncbi:MAG TPA: hypothetical protein VGG76_10315 [Gemmatimonadaceae bacterium]|jgi:hypothetical protein
MTGRALNVPPELEAAMLRALHGNSSPTADDLLSAAEHLLEDVLDSDCESRSSALSLLTVDALITRALAESAKHQEGAETFAGNAMQRLGSASR